MRQPHIPWSGEITGLEIAKLDSQGLVNDGRNFLATSWATFRKQQTLELTSNTGTYDDLHVWSLRFVV